MAIDDKQVRYSRKDGPDYFLLCQEYNQKSHSAGVAVAAVGSTFGCSGYVFGNPKK